MRTAVICSILNEDIVGVSHKSDAALIQTALPVESALQGVWNRREIQLTRRALPYDYTYITDVLLHLNKKYLSKVHLLCIQKPILNISYTNGVPFCKACIIIW